MIEAPTFPLSSLTARLVTPKRALPVAPLATLPGSLEVEAAPVRGWGEDLRFFATCYIAGAIFFLVMLS